ncbi:hypothetical protein ACJX0J_009622 [Zea mays]
MHIYVKIIHLLILHVYIDTIIYSLQHNSYLNKINRFMIIIGMTTWNNNILVGDGANVVIDGQIAFHIDGWIYEKVQKEDEWMEKPTTSFSVKVNSDVQYFLYFLEMKFFGHVHAIFSLFRNKDGVYKGF